MSETEFLEVFSSLITASLSATALYFTAVSGYLITAYIAGNKLNRSQLLIVSSLFVVFALVMSFVAFAMGERAVELEAAYEGARDALDWSNYFILAAQILGIIAALKFMMDARRAS